MKFRKNYKFSNIICKIKMIFKSCKLTKLNKYLLLNLLARKIIISDSKNRHITSTLYTIVIFIYDNRNVEDKKMPEIVKKYR